MLHTSVDKDSTIVGRDYRANGSIFPSDFADGLPTAFYAARGKRALDLVVVALALPIVLPLMLVLVSLVGIAGGKPVFSHQRVGIGGRHFQCLKFRTMALDSEARLQDLLSKDPAAAEEWAKGFKLRNDPRVTRLGRILRMTSFDELPQLWNILRGDMSLVGPRPVTEEELTLYKPFVDAYCSVRPGLTGLWQVSGRNTVSFEERVKLDRTYVKNLSFMQDFRILFRTVPTVLRRTGC